LPARISAGQIPELQPQPVAEHDHHLPGYVQHKFEAYLKYGRPLLGNELLASSGERALRLRPGKTRPCF